MKPNKRSFLRTTSLDFAGIGLGSALPEWLFAEYDWGVFKMYNKNDGYRDDDSGIWDTKNLVERAGQAMR